MGYKYFTCKELSSNTVLRQILILIEYGREIEYIQGNKNIVTDTLSHLTKYEKTKTLHNKLITYPKPCHKQMTLNIYLMVWFLSCLKQLTNINRNAPS